MHHIGRMQTSVVWISDCLKQFECRISVDANQHPLGPDTKAQTVSLTKTMPKYNPYPVSRPLRWPQAQVIGTAA